MFHRFSVFCTNRTYSVWDITEMALETKVTVIAFGAAYWSLVGFVGEPSIRHKAAIRINLRET
jgi:hypothetical protein